MIVGARGRGNHVLGLPDGVRACLFDLDGVLTDTASVHRTAWREAFAPRPFSDDDYNEWVDGKPREAGIRDFLGHLGEDTSGAVVSEIAERKQTLFEQHLKGDGVTTYDGSRRYLQACRDAGIRRAVVSSSTNTLEVLRIAGLAELIELRVDGNTAKEQQLRGKPAPDTFLAAAEQLGLEPKVCAVFEDALAGVQAGRAGQFGLVVGVDRVGHADDLRTHGADVVVQDLAELCS
jgi:beta-phosphoglucomutase family hydrolase